MTTPASTTSPAFTLSRAPLELRLRRAVLVAREHLTPHYVRVRLQGEDLRGFTSLGSDDHIRLFFPEGRAETAEEMRAAPRREFTPLAFDDDWLDLEFVLHGDHGVAGVWAGTAPLGAEIGVGGPRGSMVMHGSPDAWLLAGDETAVPAIRRFAARMPADAVGAIIIEVRDIAHELAIDVPAGVSLEFVHRGAEVEGSALSTRLDEIGESERPDGMIFGFVAAEQTVIRSGRALLLERWALPAEQAIVKGYWKRDSAAH